MVERPRRVDSSETRHGRQGSGKARILQFFVRPLVLSPRTSLSPSFKNPVLRAVQAEPVLSAVLKNHFDYGRLDRLERKRAAAPSKPAPGDFYRRLLREDIRSGNPEGAYAYLPLAFERDAESLRLLELARGSDDSDVRSFADASLAVRNRKAAEPFATPVRGP